MIPAGVCYRCEQPGHLHRECDRPPPKDQQERQQRIDRYRDRWFDGDITTTQKQAWISAENKAFTKANAQTTGGMK